MPASPVARTRVLRKTQVEQVAELISAGILGGTIPPETRLVETALAEQYGCTRHVIREALHVLEAGGLVAGDAFRGRWVRRYRGREIETLMVMRIALESGAAALAAYRVTAEDAQSLAQLATVENHRLLTYADLTRWDREVHRAIWRIGVDPLMIEQLERLIHPFMQTAMEVSEASSGNSARQLEIQLEREGEDNPGSHRALVKAIVSRDCIAARETMIMHLLAYGTSVFSQELSNVLRAAFPSVPAVVARASSGS